MADVKSIFQKLYPFLGTALTVAGGPLGSMAAQALSAVAGKEVQPADAPDVLAQLASTAEGALKLKDAEYSFQQTMTKLGYDHVEKLEELADSDRANARGREEKLGDKTPRNLAYLIVGAFVAMVLCVLFKRTAIDSVLAGTVIGYLSAKAELVASYYFGSSRSSDRKTELLAQAPAIK